MSKSALANKVGNALYEIARENNVLEIVQNDLTEAVKAINENNDFIVLMNNPNMAKEKKISLIDSIFVGVNAYVINVIKILASNMQISLLNYVLEEYTYHLNRRNKSATVKVESVIELSDEQIVELKEQLKNNLQLDKIEIENTIDKSLIGGLKITYNNKVIDASIKAKLNGLKKQISNI